MTKIIGASVVITCDIYDIKSYYFSNIDNLDSIKFEIIEDGGVVISGNKIIDVGNYFILQKKYLSSDLKNLESKTNKKFQNIELKDNKNSADIESKSNKNTKKLENIESRFYKNHILMPALINSHIHFEFSKNDSSFRYGNFGVWLNSVMDNRGAVLKNAQNAIKAAIKRQLKSGVASVCAISSYDLDLEMLLDSPLRVVFCHEVIGALESNFKAQKDSIDKRLKKTMSLQNSFLFTPAIALHSPYSVNKKLTKYVINLAKKYNLLVSTHFLESKEEYEWLTLKSGYFKDFFSHYFGLKNAKPHFSIDSFLAMFEGVRAIFTHCLYADSGVKRAIEMQENAIISCPRSNLLLNKKIGENRIIATDGKSSNNDVDMLNEARSALFAALQSPKNESIESISQRLIYAMTCLPALALGLNNGVIKAGKYADIAIFKVAENSKNDNFKANIATNFILNAKNVTRLIINGEIVL